MASLSAPYGIQPISDQGGVIRPLRVPLGIASGYGSNIFKYQPVIMSTATGTLQAAASPGPVFGVFEGVEYTPTGSRPTVSPFWAAGTTYDSTYDMFVYIWPAWSDSNRWLVQADGAVPQALLGSSFNFSNLANGSLASGLSTCTVGAAGVAAGLQGQVTLVEFYPGINSATGDAFTDLIVSFSNPQIISGPALSIG